MIKKSKKLKKKKIGGSSKSSAAYSYNRQSNSNLNHIANLKYQNLYLKKQLSDCNEKLRMSYLSIAALENHAFTVVDNLKHEITNYKAEINRLKEILTMHLGGHAA